MDEPKKSMGFVFEYTGNERFNDRCGLHQHLGTFPGMFMSRFSLHSNSTDNAHLS